MNEFLFRSINALVQRSDIFDAVISFSAQQFPLFVFLALILWAGFESMRARAPRVRGEVLKKWILIFAVAFLAWVFAQIAKELVQSPRPFLALRDVKLLFPYGDRDSFPSGHATFISALTVAVYFFYGEKKLALVLLAVTLLVGVARVAAGIHWPFDILGGIILGGAVAYGVFRGRKFF